MAFRLRPSKSLQREVKRAARDELKRVKKLLAEPIEDPEESIHQLRVGMKRLRALLQLVRVAMGEAVYRAEQQRCKALADSFAGSRDAVVGVALFGDLVGQMQDPERRERLHRGFVEMLPVAPDRHPPLGNVVQQLALMRRQVRDWPLATLNLRQLNDRLSRQYRRGARLNRQVRNDNAIALMHEWRKESKRLLYQLELLQTGSEWQKQGRRLKRLGSLLGDLHDLDMLELQLESNIHMLWLDDRLELRQLLQARRALLRERALKLGQKVFAESPAVFARSRLREWQRRR